MEAKNMATAEECATAVTSVSSPLFVEIPSDDDDDNDDNETSQSAASRRLCDAYVAVIDPKQCSSLVQRLSRELPLPSSSSPTEHNTGDADGRSMTLDFSHLKRVKRSIDCSNSNSNSSRRGNPSTMEDDAKKRQKTNAVDRRLSSMATATSRIKDVDYDDDAIPSSEKKNCCVGVLLGPVSTLNRLYGAAGRGGVDEVNLTENESTATTTATISSAGASTITTTSTRTIAKLKELLNLTEIIIQQVPCRLAESEHEHQLFHNNYWPCLYFPQKTRLYKREQRRLSEDEVQQMHMGLRQALHDAETCRDQILLKMQHQRLKTVSSIQPSQHPQMPPAILPVVVGTVVVNPALGQVVARASEERALQQVTTTTRTSSSSSTCSSSSSHSSGNLYFQNPLQTSIILALQGVSRLERQSTMASGSSIQSNDFAATGQYLCTGYDVYTTREPSVLDSMALVHARVRRVIFGGAAACSLSSSSSSSSSSSPFDNCKGNADDDDDYTNCGLTRVKVHALPGTNHKYRAFMCQPGSTLWNECRQLLLQQQPQQEKGCVTKMST
jgi:tRNA(Arg) A34 adenosine deaminase TadA